MQIWIRNTEHDKLYYLVGVSLTTCLVFKEAKFFVPDWGI
jgi:hypothetical protein